ncbi:MAG TPA: hypothetical protein VFU23_09885, partial [Gemmatimonadales bacterium]|nr:hypothetical protein [Gemmatimonadales bacterium]
MKRAILLLLIPGMVCLAGCSPGGPHRAARAPEASNEVLIVREAAVIAFWLPSVDTLSAAELGRLRQEFRRSNQVIAGYLDDTDVT